MEERSRSGLEDNLSIFLSSRAFARLEVPSDPHLVGTPRYLSQKTSPSVIMRNFSLHSARVSVYNPVLGGSVGEGWKELPRLSGSMFVRMYGVPLRMESQPFLASKSSLSMRYACLHEERASRGEKKKGGRVIVAFSVVLVGCLYSF